MILQRIFNINLLLLSVAFLIIGLTSVNSNENIEFIPFERNENTGGSLTLAGEHALQNGYLKSLSTRNKKDLPIFDAIFAPEVYENENNQHPFDDDINECGGLYKNYSTLITTPNFSIKNYEPGLNCEYIIFSPYRCPNEFHIQFLDFHIEYSENCTKDFLEIGIEPRICGQIVGIKNYKTEDGVLVINFRSDGTIEDKGFKLLITRQPCKDDYIIRKLRQNSLTLNDDRNSKSLNVKGIANHLLPPEKIKGHNEDVSKENTNILLTLNNNNYKIQETMNQKHSNSYINTNIPVSIPNDKSSRYLSSQLNSVPFPSSVHSNYNVPLPNSNPLLPPVGNANEYLPPPQNIPQSEIGTNIIPDNPTFILGSDDANINLPNYPNCHSYPNQFYPIKPPLSTFREIPKPILIQHPNICCHPPYSNLGSSHNYHLTQNLPYIPNLLYKETSTFPTSTYTPINSNYPINNHAKNNPIESFSNNILHPLNASSVFYSEYLNSLSSKVITNPTVQFQSQSQILGIIPSRTLPPCCGNVFREKRFYLSSPGFPYSSNYLTDCLYYIRRNNPNICRLRINFKFFSLGNTPRYNGFRQFNYIPAEICVNDFIEIDGQRLCGCKTGFEYISQWGLDDKIIRLKLFGQSGNHKKNGFILDVLQEECPIRLRKSTDDNDLSLMENTVKSEYRVKRQVLINKPTEDPSSQFFIFQNKESQCIFTPADLFKLIIESPWINRPQCIPVGQAIFQV